MWQRPPPSLLKHIFLVFGQQRCSYSPQLKTLMDMTSKKVLVTHEADTTAVGISFRYTDEERRVDRIFNLQRSTDETLSAVLTRISGNIMKIVNKKKKKTEPAAEDVRVLVVDSDKGENVDENLTCYDTFVEGSGKHTLVIGDKHFCIDLNPPIINNLSLPKNIMAGYPVNLDKIEMSFADVEASVVRWFKSELKFESEKEAKAKCHGVKWEEVMVGASYVTTADDVGRLLKVVVTPCLGERQGEAGEVVSPVLVSAGPGECPFERRHQLTRTVAGERSFRVISYNILADLYADSDHARANLFPTCPAYAIDMDYRKQLLIKEITGYNGDVICLQEVDEKVFLRDLVPALKRQGLEGTYCSKGGQVSEGVALFYRTNKVRLLEWNRFILSQELQTNVLFADMWRQLESNQELASRMVERTTALQVSVLESVEDPARLLVVGITHLYFHPDADHIRLLQAGISLQILRQVMTLYETKYPEKKVGLLFCGDFNSTPEFGVYRLMTTQYVDMDDVDWESKPSERVSGVNLSHDLELASACGCPPYTNFTVGFYGCLDYIFYQTDQFSVKQVVPMPSHEEVTEHIALPSITVPSDHLPLIADLQFK